MGKSREPIADLEAEQSVLGAVMVRPEVLDDIGDKLTVSDFYREAHGKIWEAMIYLYEISEPVDLVTVTVRLRELGWLDRVGGPVFLAGLSEQVGFATNAAYYAKKVRDKSRLRAFYTTSCELAEACYGKMDSIDNFLDRAESRIIAQGDSRAGTVKSLNELVPPEVARLEDLYGKSGLTGVGTGFIDLDTLTGGFQKTDLIIIAARPSMGKTALALNIAQNAASLYGVPSLVFSMEMSDGQLVDRLLAGTAKVDAKLLKSGMLKGTEWAAVSKASGELMDTPIYICDKPALTPLEMRAMARRAKAKHKIGMVVVDYIQLAQDPRAASREQEISAISRGLKALAKELGVPVVALSQLNREVEKRPNKRPIMADLRESGAIEQDADLILFIYRQDAYQEDQSQWTRTAEVRLAKHRNGPTGLVTLTYFPDLVSFKSATRG